MMKGQENSFRQCPGPGSQSGIRRWTEDGPWLHLQLSAPKESSEDRRRSAKMYRTQHGVFGESGKWKLKRRKLKEALFWTHSGLRLRSIFASYFLIFSFFQLPFITLRSVGYGDITPVSRITRWLAAMEAMTGLLLLAFLVARLVSLYSSANLRIRDDVARASRPCRGSPKVL